MGIKSKVGLPSKNWVSKIKSEFELLTDEERVNLFCELKIKSKRLFDLGHITHYLSIRHKLDAVVHLVDIDKVRDLYRLRKPVSMVSGNNENTFLKKSAC